ncbi:DUF2809 domain-containing protein [Agromyces ramosus]|uniref:DUF2809 domain-containing protein n=1 Tax=Agromyces ramosus TaxID=33879 RepID=A0ABU0R9C2_9MICO|nr:DUF2809 domain-containing protein [Agromyces ramosus]MDQ0894673.1 hypothetical protein [Agromyces ramosus]
MTRVRVPSIVALAGCLALGLGLQLLDRSPVVDVAGGMLYVCAAGLVLSAVWTGLSSPVVALVAFAFALAVELLQLTAVPQTVVAAFPPARLLFGSSFDPVDLLVYAGGAVLLLGMRLAIVRITTRRSSAPATDR